MPGTVLVPGTTVKDRIAMSPVFMELINRVNRQIRQM